MTAATANEQAAQARRTVRSDPLPGYRARPGWPKGEDGISASHRIRRVQDEVAGRGHVARRRGSEVNGILELEVEKRIASMSDKSLAVQIPELLLARAQAANIDLRAMIIETLERMTQPVQLSMPEAPSQTPPADSRSPREIGYLRGQIWTSDDFDDELPDSFWFGPEA